MGSHESTKKIIELNRNAWQDLDAFHPVHDMKLIKTLISVRQDLPEFTQSRVYDIIADSGLLLKGHFDLLSKRHSEYFIMFSNLARYPKSLRFVSELIADKIRDEGLQIDAILTPETAGSYLATVLGMLLSKGTNKSIEIVFAKTDDERRPYEVINSEDLGVGRRVLLVNDMMTTGNGMEKLGKLAENYGASIVGMALFTTRVPLDSCSFVKKHVGQFKYCLTDASALEQYTYNAPCPICGSGMSRPIPSKLLN